MKIKSILDPYTNLLSLVLAFLLIPLTAEASGLVGSGSNTTTTTLPAATTTTLLTAAADDDYDDDLPIPMPSLCDPTNPNNPPGDYMCCFGHLTPRSSCCNVVTGQPGCPSGLRCCDGHCEESCNSDPCVLSPGTFSCFDSANTFSRCCQIGQTCDRSAGTCNDDPDDCRAGTQSCGDYCYNPNVEKCCHYPSASVKPIGEACPRSSGSSDDDYDCECVPAPGSEVSQAFCAGHVNPNTNPNLTTEEKCLAAAPQCQCE